MQTRSITALTNARLIDGIGAEPVAGATVVVAGAVILAAGAAVGIPDDAEILDLGGATVMPGLIDGHVHLRAYAGHGKADVHLWNVTTFIEEQTLHAAGNALRALNAGVTTVRDMAGGRPEVALKHAIDDGVLPGARVIASGFVGMTAGHGDMFCPAAVDHRLWPPADGVDACRTLVRQYARDGLDLIKICTSGGVLSVGDRNEWRNYTLEETQAIVDEAHALGMRVAAHAHTRAGIRQALEAGVDTLEHGSSLDAELIELMLARGTWLCPTLAIVEYIMLNGRARGVPEESLAKAGAMRANRLESVRAAYEAGVPIFMGTDSCNTFPFGDHAWELDLLQRQLGMSPMEALVAATRSAAEALDIANLTGTVEPGKRADLLIIEGDPLADLTLLRDPNAILAVFQDGELKIERGLPTPMMVLTR
jgi:imidazolonepropionase-like amidohydrolase